MDIFLPVNASAAKKARILGQGARIHYHGTDIMHTEMNARRFAERTGGYYVSPYNDMDVIAGNGTVGLEIMKQLPRKPDYIFIPVS